MNKRAFGSLEFSVLNLLKSGERKTVKEIHQILGEQDHKYTTIMTVMVRLTQKNMLAREKIGSQYEYWLLPNTKNIPSFLTQIKKMVFGINPAEVFSYLIDSGSAISDREFEEMEKMLKEARSKEKIKHYVMEDF